MYNLKKKRKKESDALDGVCHHYALEAQNEHSSPTVSSHCSARDLAMHFNFLFFYGDIFICVLV